MSSLLKANNVTKIFGGGMFSKEQELIAEELSGDTLFAEISAKIIVK